MRLVTGVVTNNSYFHAFTKDDISAFGIEDVVVRVKNLETDKFTNLRLETVQKKFKDFCNKKTIMDKTFLLTCPYCLWNCPDLRYIDCVKVPEFVYSNTYTMPINRIDTISGVGYTLDSYTNSIYSTSVIDLKHLLCRVYLFFCFIFLLHYLLYVNLINNVSYERFMCAVFEIPMEYFSVLSKLALGLLEV